MPNNRINLFASFEVISTPNFYNKSYLEITQFLEKLGQDVMNQLAANASNYKEFNDAIQSMIKSAVDFHLNLSQVDYDHHYTIARDIRDALNKYNSFVSYLLSADEKGSHPIFIKAFEPDIYYDYVDFYLSHFVISILDKIIYLNFVIDYVTQHFPMSSGPYPGSSSNSYVFKYKSDFLIPLITMRDGLSNSDAMTKILAEWDKFSSKFGINMSYNDFLNLFSNGGRFLADKYRPRDGSSDTKLHTKTSIYHLFKCLQDYDPVRFNFSVKDIDYKFNSGKLQNQPPVLIHDMHDNYKANSYRINVEPVFNNLTNDFITLFPKT